MEAHSFARSDGGLTLPRSRKLLAAFSDDRLVAQVRRGNDAAFEVLYDRHHAAVLSYCRHMLGSRDEGEDALQQAFVSAHADIVASDKPIRFKAWIYAIARNRCLSMLRARRERPTDELEQVSTVGLSDEVQQRAELKELLGDMHELPEDQRTALILSELGDLSHADVAQVIGCEVAKVKSLVFQARSGLMERRQARETPCQEIREQLSTLRGGALRRGPLRRHLKACPGCTEFRDEVKRQRQMVAVLLPVVPTLGLKESALAAAGVSATTAGSGVLAGGGAGAVLAAKASVAKVAVVAVATTGAAGGAVAVKETVVDGSRSDRGAQKSEAAGATAPGHQKAEGAGGTLTGDTGKSAPGDADETSRSKPESQANGFEPVKGESNGERAREFANSRGNGHHKGIAKQRGTGTGPNANANANSLVKGPGSRTAKPKPERPPQAGPPEQAGPKPKPEGPLAPVLTAPDLLPPGKAQSQSSKGKNEQQDACKPARNPDAQECALEEGAALNES